MKVLSHLDLREFNRKQLDFSSCLKTFHFIRKASLVLRVSLGKLVISEWAQTITNKEASGGLESSGEAECGSCHMCPGVNPWSV